MRSRFFIISTRLVAVPNVCGKACAYYKGLLWDACGQFLGFVHSVVFSSYALRTTSSLYHGLYTKCTRLYTPLFSLFTPVEVHLYTVSTVPTNITTTYINNLLGE